MDMQIWRDRERREVRAPVRYGYADLVAYSLIVEKDDQWTDPISYKDAVIGEDNKHWEAAMRDELDSLMKNDTWKLVIKPKD